MEDAMVMFIDRTIEEGEEFLLYSFPQSGPRFERYVGLRTVFASLSGVAKQITDQSMVCTRFLGPGDTLVHMAIEEQETFATVLLVESHSLAMERLCAMLKDIVRLLSFVVGPLSVEYLKNCQDSFNPFFRTYFNLETDNYNRFLLSLESISFCRCDSDLKKTIEGKVKQLEDPSVASTEGSNTAFNISSCLTHNGDIICSSIVSPGLVCVLSFCRANGFLQRSADDPMHIGWYPVFLEGQRATLLITAIFNTILCVILTPESTGEMATERPRDTSDQRANDGLSPFYVHGVKECLLGLVSSGVFSDIEKNDSNCSKLCQRLNDVMNLGSRHSSDPSRKSSLSATSRKSRSIMFRSAALRTIGPDYKGIYQIVLNAIAIDNGQSAFVHSRAESIHSGTLSARFATEAARVRRMLRLYARVERTDYDSEGRTRPENQDKFATSPLWNRHPRLEALSRAHVSEYGARFSLSTELVEEEVGFWVIGRRMLSERVTFVFFNENVPHSVVEKAFGMCTALDDL
eukprot:215930_1